MHYQLEISQMRTIIASCNTNLLFPKPFLITSLENIIIWRHPKRIDIWVIPILCKHYRQNWKHHSLYLNHLYRNRTYQTHTAYFFQKVVQNEGMKQLLCAETLLQREWWLCITYLWSKVIYILSLTYVNLFH